RRCHGPAPDRPARPVRAVRGERGDRAGIAAGIRWGTRARVATAGIGNSPAPRFVMTLLKDPDRQQEFESRGYTVLRFLDESETARLARLYASLKFECTSSRLSAVGGEHPALLRPLRDAFEEIAAAA